MKFVILAVLLIAGVGFTAYGLSLKQAGAVSMAVIGGADGPTAIFVAGKMSDHIIDGILVAGVILLMIAVFVYIKIRRKRGTK